MEKESRRPMTGTAGQQGGTLNAAGLHRTHGENVKFHVMQILLQKKTQNPKPRHFFNVARSPRSKAGLDEARLAPL